MSSLWKNKRNSACKSNGVRVNLDELIKDKESYSAMDQISSYSTIYRLYYFNATIDYLSLMYMRSIVLQRND